MATLLSQFNFLLDDESEEERLLREQEAPLSPTPVEEAPVEQEAFEPQSLSDLNFLLEDGGDDDFTEDSGEEVGRLADITGRTAAGAAELVASIPESAAIQASQARKQAGEAGDVFGSLGDPFRSDSLGAELFKGKFEESHFPEEEDKQEIIDLAANMTVEDVVKNPAFQLGASIRAGVAKALPTNDKYDDELVSSLASGFGSLLGFVATTTISPVLGAALGASANASSQFRDSIIEGADIEDAFKAANIGALAGTTEVFAPAMMLGRMNKATGGWFSKRMTESVKKILEATPTRTALGALEEAFQEVTMEMMNNYSASDLVGYDEDRELFKGTEESGTVGGILGAFMNFASATVGKRGGGAQARFSKKRQKAFEKAVEKDVVTSELVPEAAEIEARELLSPDAASITIAESLPTIDSTRSDTVTPIPKATSKLLEDIGPMTDEGFLAEINQPSFFDNELQEIGDMAQKLTSGEVTSGERSEFTALVNAYVAKGQESAETIAPDIAPEPIAEPAAEIEAAPIQEQEAVEPTTPLADNLKTGTTLFRGAFEGTNETLVAGDLGVHFTPDEAVASSKAGETGAVDSFQVKIENPLTVQSEPENGAWHDPASVIAVLEEAGVTIPSGLKGRAIAVSRGPSIVANPAKDSSQRKVLNAISANLKKQGFDAVVYPNAFEGKGTDSVLLLDTKGLKPEVAEVAEVAPEAPARTPQKLKAGLRFEAEEDVNTSNLLIKDKKGETVGAIESVINSEGTSVQIQEAELDVTIRGKGNGVKAYIEFIQQQQRRGREVTSDHTVTQDALNVWKSLERKGFPVVINETIQKNKGGKGATTFYTATNGNPIVMITEEFTPSTIEQVADKAAQKSIDKFTEEQAKPFEDDGTPLQSRVLAETSQAMEAADVGQVEEFTLANGTEIIAKRRKDSFTWAVKGEPITNDNAGTVPIETVVEEQGPLPDQDLPTRAPVGPKKIQPSAPRFTKPLTTKQQMEADFALFTLPSRGLFETMRDKELSFADKMLQGTAKARMATRRYSQDKFIALKRIQEAVVKSGGTVEDFMDTYAREINIHGRVGNTLERLDSEVLVPMYNVMAAAKLTREDVGEYLTARHAKSRNAMIAEVNEKFPDGGSGMTNQKAESILQFYETKGKTAALEEIADLAYEITNRTRNNFREFGLVRGDVIDAWEEDTEFNRTYIPLKGFQDAAAEEFGGIGQGFDIRGAEVKSALGRETRAADVLGNLVAAHTTSTIRGEKNHVGQSLLELVQANPNKDLWEVNVVKTKFRRDEDTGMAKEVMDLGLDNPNVFLIKKDGKAYRIELKDDRLASAMKNLGVDNMGSFMHGVATLTRYISLTRTMYSPSFLVTNPARDIQAAIVNLQGEHGTEFRRKAVGLSPKAFKETVGRATWALWHHNRGNEKHGDPETKEWIDEWLAAGGKVDFFREKSIEQYAKGVDSMVKRLQPGASGNIRRAAHSTHKFIEDMNSSVENAVRLSAYIAARKSGLTEQQAANLSKELTVNFNRKGTAGPHINALFMFYNASIQGAERFIRAAKNPRVRKILYTMAASAAAITAYNELAGGDDEDGESFYSKIPDHIKQRNSIYMVPEVLHEALRGKFGFHEVGKGKKKGLYFKFPLPYGYSIPYSIGQNIAELGFGKTAVDAALDIMSAANNSFNPMGDSTAQLLFSPSLADPFLEVITNRNYFGGKIFDEGSGFGFQVPDSERGRESTADIYKWAAKELNSLSGGDPSESGFMDFHPESIRHIIEFPMGGTGQFAERVVDNVEAVFSDEKEFDINRLAIARKFVGESEDFQDVNRYFRNKENLEILEHRQEELTKDIKAKNLPRSRMTEFRDENSKILEARLMSTLKKTETKIAKLRKEKKMLAERPDTERNRKRIKHLKDQILVHQIRFNTQYNKVMLDRGFIRAMIGEDK